MSRVKQQLKAFYRGKGLKGKRLKRAVWADVGRVKVNRMDQHGRPLIHCRGISYQFVWNSSPEGHDYWMARNGEAR